MGYHPGVPDQEHEQPSSCNETVILSHVSRSQMLTPIWSLFLGTILHLYGNAVMMGEEADSHILPAISPAPAHKTVPENRNIPIAVKGMDTSGCGIFIPFLLV